MKGLKRAEKALMEQNKMKMIMEMMIGFIEGPKRRNEDAGPSMGGDSAPLP